MVLGRTYILVAMAAVICSSVSGAFASASEQRDRLASSTQTLPAEEPSVFTYSHVDKSCVVWNDGCRTCLNSPANGVNCSNVGFACQIKPISCDVRRPK